MSMKFERLICDEISRLGGVVERVVRNKHPKIYFTVGTKTFVHICAGSPGDHRSLANNRAILRRQLARRESHGLQPHSR
jgi:hypothetical protein